MPIRWRIAILTVAGMLLPVDAIAVGGASEQETYEAPGGILVAEYEERRQAVLQDAPVAETDPDALYAAAYRSARLGDVEAAADRYARALAAYIAARRTSDPETAVTLVELAELYPRLGRDDLAAHAAGLAHGYPFQRDASAVDIIRYFLSPSVDIGADASSELREALAEARNKTLAEFWLPGALAPAEVEPLRLVEFFVGTGNLLLAHGLTADALAVLEIAIEQVNAGREPILPSALECAPAAFDSDAAWERMNALFTLYHQLGDLAAAIHGEDDVGIAGLTIELALLYQRRQDFETAQFGLNMALETLRAQVSPPQAALALAYYRLGCLYRFELYDTDPLPHFEAALDLSESAFPPDHPDRLAILVWGGLIYAEVGDGERARAPFDAALDALQRGALDGMAALQALDIIDQGADRAGLYDRREEMVALRQSLLEQNLDSDDPAFVEAFERLAWDHMEFGRYAEAIALLERILDMTRLEAPSEDGFYMRLRRLRELADLYREAGDAAGEADALARLLALHALRVDELGLSHERADLLLRLARLYDGLGRGAEAGALYHDGLALFEEYRDPLDSVLAYAFHDYGEHHLRQGEMHAAREMFARVIERWGDWPDMEEIVEKSRAGLTDIAAGDEAAAARLLVARARRHNDLLNEVGRLESEYAQASGDTALLGALIEAYSALLAYEQATDLGSNLFTLASRRLVRFAALADPADTAAAAFIARINANLYMILRAYPEANRWLADAGELGEAEMLRRMLAALGQERFEVVEEYALGPFTVSVAEATGTPPGGKLLWPLLHFTVRPFAAAPPHRTIAFSLVRQGDGEAVRYYLYLHSLNRARLVALFGGERPAYETVKQRLAASMGTALALAQYEDTP